MIISMAYTSSAFVARRKVITRRSWVPHYAERVGKMKVLDAYSKDPRYGGTPIGALRLTSPLKYASIAQDSPESIYEEEGFAYLDGPEKPLWDACKEWWKTGEYYWECRFEVTSVNVGAWDKYTSGAEIAKARASLLKHLQEAVADHSKLLRPRARPKLTIKHHAPRRVAETAQVPIDKWF